MPARIEFVVYLVGVAVLGLIYEPVKSAAGSGLVFLACGIAYLLFLRAIGYLVRRYVQSRTSQ